MVVKYRTYFIVLYINNAERVPAFLAIYLVECHIAE